VTYVSVIDDVTAFMPALLEAWEKEKPGPGDENDT